MFHFHVFAVLMLSLSPPFSLLLLSIFVCVALQIPLLLLLDQTGVVVHYFRALYDHHKQGMNEAAVNFGEKLEGMKEATGKDGGKLYKGFVFGAVLFSSLSGLSACLVASLFVHDTIFTTDVLCVSVFVMFSLVAMEPRL